MGDPKVVGKYPAGLTAEMIEAMHREAMEQFNDPSYDYYDDPTCPLCNSDSATYPYDEIVDWEDQPTKEVRRELGLTHYCDGCKKFFTPELVWFDCLHSTVDKYDDVVPNECCDPVKKPLHYVAEDGIEVKDVLTSFGYHKNSHRWNAGKYILRAGRKDGTLEGTIKDLRKAMRSLEYEIELIEKGMI